MAVFVHGCPEIPVLFPKEPTGYTLITRYNPLRSSSALGNNIDHVFTAPEDGWYKVMLFGSSGMATATNIDWENDDYESHSGGSGGCAVSIVKLNKGDTVDLYIGEGARQLTHPHTAEDSKVIFHPTTGETYSNLVVTAGQNGGSGGKASGGNYTNVNGRSYYAITVDGITGAEGGYSADPFAGGGAYDDGDDGFVVILRGNTNRVM